MSKRAPLALYIVLLVCFCFLMSGCDITTKTVVATKIDQAGAGQRDFAIYINNDILQHMKIDTIYDTLKKNCPSCLKIMAPEKISSGYIIYFEMYFSNINDLKSQSSYLLGYNPAIAFESSGSPFYQKFVFIDNTNPKDYFNWVNKAVSQISKDVNLIFETSSVLQMPGENEPSTFKGKATSELKYDISSYLVSISTSLSSGSSATIKLNIPVDTDAKIVTSYGKSLQDYLENRFQTKVTRENGSYSLTISSIDLKGMEARLRNTLDPNMVLALDPESNSFFVDKYQLTVDGDLAKWVGTGINISNKNVTLDIPDTTLDQSTQTSFKDTKVKTTISFAVYNKKNIALLSTFIVILILLPTIWVVYRRRKNAKVEQEADVGEESIDV